MIQDVTVVHASDAGRLKSWIWRSLWPRAVSERRAVCHADICHYGQSPEMHQDSAVDDLILGSTASVVGLLVKCQGRSY